MTTATAAPALFADFAAACSTFRRACERRASAQRAADAAYLRAAEATGTDGEDVALVAWERAVALMQERGAERLAAAEAAYRAGMRLNAALDADPYAPGVEETRRRMVAMASEAQEFGNRVFADALRPSRREVEPSAN